MDVLKMVSHLPSDRYNKIQVHHLLKVVSLQKILLLPTDTCVSPGCVRGIVFDTLFSMNFCFLSDKNLSVCLFILTLCRMKCLYVLCISVTLKYFNRRKLKEANMAKF